MGEKGYVVAFFGEKEPNKLIQLFDQTDGIVRMNDSIFQRIAWYF